VGPTSGLVTGGDGLAYYVAHGLDGLAWADLVFVPGYRFPDRDDPPQVVADALIAAHAGGGAENYVRAASRSIRRRGQSGRTGVIGPISMSVQARWRGQRPTGHGEYGP